jgi:hypothetical protein
MARMDASWIVRLGATRTLAYNMDIYAFAATPMARMVLRQTAVAAPMWKPWLAVGRHLMVVVGLGRIASTARFNNSQ